MRGYGLPRNHDVEAPDCLDIATYGLKSCIGSVVRKNGERHNSFRNVDAKARTRRIWAKKARAEGKAAACDE